MTVVRLAILLHSEENQEQGGTMLTVGSVTQPLGRSNLDLIADTVRAAEFDYIDVAAAYVTSGGARDVLRVLRAGLGDRWHAVKKRWVVSLDYCRTEPQAMEMLLREPRSSVRVHDGSHVVAQGCIPRIPFHPKAFLFRGNGHHVVFAGSGNLSRSGMNTGHEVGLMMGCFPPVRRSDPSVITQVQAVQAWYEDVWTRADRLNQPLLDQYKLIYDSIPNKLAPAPTDDDIIDSLRRGALTSEQLRKLRVCTQFWIEAGNVTRNLGPAAPGNQLMMKRLSRIFFGVPAIDVPQNSPLTQISITHQNRTKTDCSLTFSDNGMDKLTLPIPGAGGPTAYDQQTLLFTRLSPGAFELELGTPKKIRNWVHRSKLIDASYAMQGGRRWGLF